MSKQKFTRTGRTIVLRKGDRILFEALTLTIARIANVHVYFEEVNTFGERIIATREGLNERLLSGEARLEYDDEKAYRRALKPIF